MGKYKLPIPLEYKKIGYPSEFDRMKGDASTLKELKSFCEINYKEIVKIWSGIDYSNFKTLCDLSYGDKYRCEACYKFDEIFNKLKHNIIPKEILNWIDKYKGGNPEAAEKTMEKNFKAYKVNSLITLVTYKDDGISFDKALKEVLYSELLESIIKNISREDIGDFPRLNGKVDRNLTFLEKQISELKKELKNCEDNSEKKGTTFNMITCYGYKDKIERLTEKKKEVKAAMLKNYSEATKSAKFLTRVHNTDFKIIILDKLKEEHRWVFNAFCNIPFYQILSYPSVDDKEGILRSYLGKQTERVSKNKRRKSNRSNKMKREEIENELIRNPHYSDNKIAKELKVDPKTVKKVREEKGFTRK